LYKDINIKITPDITSYYQLLYKKLLYDGTIDEALDSLPAHLIDYDLVQAKTVLCGEEENLVCIHLNPVIVRKFPVGKAIKTTSYMPGKMGIYQCANRTKRVTSVDPIEPSEVEEGYYWECDRLMKMVGSIGYVRTIAKCAADIEQFLNNHSRVTFMPYGSDFLLEGLPNHEGPIPSIYLAFYFAYKRAQLRSFNIDTGFIDTDLVVIRRGEKLPRSADIARLELNMHGIFLSSRCYHLSKTKTELYNKYKSFL
jgi:hypothetical protein